MGLFSGLISKVAAPVVGGVLGLAGGERQNDASASSARQAQGFTKEQMQNKHQWQVKDLRKAGLNPILSAGSPPSIGASAQANVPSNSLGEAGSKAVSTSLAVQKQRAEIDLLRSQAAKAASEKKGIDHVNSVKSNAGDIADFISPYIAGAGNLVNSAAGSYVSSARAVGNYLGDQVNKSPKVRSWFLKDAKGNTYYNPKKGK